MLPLETVGTGKEHEEENCYHTDDNDQVHFETMEPKLVDSKKLKKKRKLSPLETVGTGKEHEEENQGNIFHKDDDKDGEVLVDTEDEEDNLILVDNDDGMVEVVVEEEEKISNIS